MLTLDRYVWNIAELRCSPSFKKFPALFSWITALWIFSEMSKRRYTTRDLFSVSSQTRCWFHVSLTSHCKNSVSQRRFNTSVNPIKKLSRKEMKIAVYQGASFKGSRLCCPGPSVQSAVLPQLIAAHNRNLWITTFSTCYPICIFAIGQAHQ